MVAPAPLLKQLFPCFNQLGLLRFLEWVSLFERGRLHFAAILLQVSIFFNPHKKVLIELLSIEDTLYK